MQQAAMREVNAATTLIVAEPIIVVVGLIFPFPCFVATYVYTNKIRLSHGSGYTTVSTWKYIGGRHKAPRYIYITIPYDLHPTTTEKKAG